MSDSEDDFDDDPSLDEEPIHRAAREGDLAALRRELDAGYSPDCLCTVDNITPLQILCMKRQDGGCQASNDIRLQGVKILLAAGATDRVEGQDPDESALTHAAYLGYYPIVKALLAAGFDATVKCPDGWSPLHATASAGLRANAPCALALMKAGTPIEQEWYWDEKDADKAVYTPLLVAMERANVTGQGSAPNYVLRALLRGGATLDMTLIERYGYAVPTHPDYPYVARVHAAGGWKRYEQAHIMRLAPIFSKIFPQSRLPHEMVAHVVSFWAHVGHY